MKFAAAALFIALLAGLSFSAIAVRDLRKQVADLENKVTSLSERPPVVATATPADSTRHTETSAPHSDSPTTPASTGDSASGTIFDPGSNSPVARKAGGSDAPTGGPSVNPSAWTEADRAAFEKEVQTVLDKQQKERESKQEARQNEWMVARLKEQLKLTDQQAEQIGTVLASAMDQVRELRGTITPENREEVRPKIQATVQAADAQVKGMLTAEQSAAYDEMKKNGGGFGFGGGGQGGGGGGRKRGQGQGGGGEPQ
ncbi:MAG: hypothetical protein K8T20_07145 [Planctomycetes bacterium]|nr:hypothetical protein [Planctomycetota bacterium]